MIRLIGNHWMRIRSDGTLKYGRHGPYPLAGVHARMENTGWRGQKHVIVVEGPDFEFATGVHKYRNTAMSVMTAINHAAKSVTT